MHKLIVKLPAFQLKIPGFLSNLNMFAVPVRSWTGCELIKRRVTTEIKGLEDSMIKTLIIKRLKNVS